MKRVSYIVNTIKRRVAPHAGAWIETSGGLLCPLGVWVAPHAGAWIETMVKRILTTYAGVAPHAGAWIETPGSGGVHNEGGGRPPRGGVD
mgnify:CR=1 FL=1